MKIINKDELKGTDRQVNCPDGGFSSDRLVIASDKTGYSVTRTSIPVGEKQHWHYKNHIETCYCISGKGVLTDALTGNDHLIEPGTTYVLNDNDDHYFQALEPVEMLCVFNPPLVGHETHMPDGSYQSPRSNSPTYNVIPVPIENVVANDYNPNSVAPPEMALLETSIWEDGYTQPVVTCFDEENNNYVVVDGFHRYLTIKNSDRIREREKGLLPVVVLDKSIGDRMASTIRHNRARGSHNIDLMSTIVAELVEMGKGDRWICKHIGMSADELLRMKQITGVAALFQNRDFSDSWEAEND